MDAVQIHRLDERIDQRVHDDGEVLRLAQELCDDFGLFHPCPWAGVPLGGPLLHIVCHATAG